MNCINQACGRELDDHWIACPFCQTPAVSEDCPVCSKCHRPIEPGWQSCPYCSTVVYEEVAIDSLKDGEITTMTDIDIEMVYVEPGTFLMGSDDEYADGDDIPLHEVSLSNGFWIGKYLVTQNEYEMVMNKNNSEFKGSELLPVEYISWYDAVAFCEKLTGIEQQNDLLPEGYIYRLPTEAEWEFSARGGNKSCGFKYSGSDDIDEVGWYNENSDKQTHNVGLGLANELGIYDMSGNVCEWCHDWYGEYCEWKQIDPAGKASGYTRVCRGGNWFYFADYCRTTDRLHITPSDTNSGVGFRIVLAPVIANIMTSELLALNNLGRE